MGEWVCLFSFLLCCLLVFRSKNDARDHMVIVVGRKVRKMWRRMYGVEVGGGEH